MRGGDVLIALVLLPYLVVILALLLGMLMDPVRYVVFAGMKGIVALVPRIAAVNVAIDPGPLSVSLPGISYESPSAGLTLGPPQDIWMLVGVFTFLASSGLVLGRLPAIFTAMRSKE